MPIVARGLKMAIDECQKRFAFNHWNCTLILSGSHLDPNRLDYYHENNSDRDGATNNQLIYGNAMRYPNRERSFLNAISAAALAHSMTKACRQGELPEECGCDRKIRSSHKGRIEWIGCSDDFDYGAKFSRDFTDNFDTNEPDAIKTIYLHNSEVGRRVFKAITEITCTCSNGEPGLCDTKRCWKHIGSFSDIVDQIMERYESATHVQRSNKDPQKLRPVRRGVRRPKRKDLVFIDESPDYCRQDLR
jgi:wingless-type MMTV integration site family protein 5